MKKFMIMNKKIGNWTRKKVIIVSVIVFVVVFPLYIIYQFNTFHSIDFELIYETELPSDYKEGSSQVWKTYSDNSFNKFIKSPDYIDDIKLDFDNFTYIIVNNHQLVDFKYTWKEVNLRKFVIFPELYVGFATFTKEETGKQYVYRIKRMNINADYHGKNDNNTFID